MIYSLESAVNILLSPKGWLLLLIYGLIFIISGSIFILKNQPSTKSKMLFISFAVGFINIIPFLIDPHIDDVLINVSDRVAAGLPIALFLFDFVSMYTIGLIIADKATKKQNE